MTIKLGLVLSLSMFLLACSSVPQATQREACKDAVTFKPCMSLVLSDFNKFTDPSFLTDEDENLTGEPKSPIFKGFVVSIDKSKYANYGPAQKLPIADSQKRSPTDYAIVGNSGAQINFASANSLTNKRMKARIRKTFTRQQKAMFVTGIKPFNINSNFHYNITTACGDRKLNEEQTFIDCSFEALDQFENALTSELNSTRYSHVILHSTGWHNRQDDSIKHYNKLFQSLNDSANLSDPDAFKPLYIGLTWPADWDLPIISYLNKANDADEVGFIWANYLLNKTLPTAIANSQQNVKPKFVAMGHSFGARVMATAARSKPYITSGHSDKKLDTLVLIQPAMSAVRLHNDTEGDTKGFAHFNYYQGIEDQVENIIMTSSARDTTNGYAFWSGRGTGHAGTVKSYNLACADIENKSLMWKERFLCRQQKTNATNNWRHLLEEPQLVLYLRLDTKSEKNTDQPYTPCEDAIKDHNAFKDEVFTNILYPLIK